MTQPLSPPSFRFVDGRVHVEVDLRTYRLVAVQKTAYRFADRCTAVLGAPDGTSMPVTLILRAGISENSAVEVARLFFQELLDQELREHLGEETRPVRALILAQAFSKTDLVRR
jgi:His-Xaa-Ser system protein HxsD